MADESVISYYTIKSVLSTITDNIVYVRVVEEPKKEVKIKMKDLIGD